MRQLEVQIMGQSYTLTCPENSELRLREAVSRVDKAMCMIRDSGKVRARDRIAVLAALNLTFELLGPMVAPAPAASSAQAPSAPPPAAPGQNQSRQKDPNEASSKAPAQQLDTLLQRLNAALGNDERHG